MIRIKLWPLVSPLFEDSGDNSSAEVLIVFYFLVVDNLVLHRNPHNPKLRVVSYLAHLPLLISIKVIVKCLLLKCLKILELEDLSEQVLTGHCPALVRVWFWCFVFQVK